MEHKKILLVDDEPSARELILRVLEKAGYEVVAFGTGEDALEYLATDAVDLLMIDKVLPRMSGLDVIAKARETLPNVPVVLITAVPDPFVVMQHKLDVYISKPFRNLKVLEEGVLRAFELKADALARADLKRQLDEVQSRLGTKRT